MFKFFAVGGENINALAETSDPQVLLVIERQRRHKIVGQRFVFSRTERFDLPFADTGNSAIR